MALNGLDCYVNDLISSYKHKKYEKMYFYLIMAVIRCYIYVRVLSFQVLSVPCMAWSSDLPSNISK